MKILGHIDALTVAFYVNLNCPDGGSCSHIKFGSYDDINIQPGHQLKLAYARSYLSWDIDLDDFFVGNSGGVLFDPV